MICLCNSWLIVTFLHFFNSQLLFFFSFFNSRVHCGLLFIVLQVRGSKRQLLATVCVECCVAAGVVDQYWPFLTNVLLLIVENSWKNRSWVMEILLLLQYYWYMGIGSVVCVCQAPKSFRNIKNSSFVSILYFQHCWSSHGDWVAKDISLASLLLHQMNCTASYPNPYV